MVSSEDKIQPIVKAYSEDNFKSMVPIVDNIQPDAIFSRYIQLMVHSVDDIQSMLSSVDNIYMIFVADSL